VHYIHYILPRRLSVFNTQKYAADISDVVRTTNRSKGRSFIILRRPVSHTCIGQSVPPGQVTGQWSHWSVNRTVRDWHVRLRPKY